MIVQFRNTLMKLKIIEKVKRIWEVLRKRKKKLKKVNKRLLDSLLWSKSHR